MRTLVVCICLFGGLATAQKDMLQQASKGFEKIQLNGLAKMRFFAHKANLSAPWIKKWLNVAEVQGRRMQDDEPVLPPACVKECPEAKAPMEKLKLEFVQEAMANPYIQKMMTQSEADRDKEPTAADIKDMMDAMVPLIKMFYQKMFAMMCTNGKEIQCLADNADGVCKPGDSMDNKCGGSMFDSLGEPVCVAKQFKNSMDCICKRCTLAQDMMINFAASMMTAAGNAFSSVEKMEGKDDVSMEDAKKVMEAMQKDMLGGLCPMVGVNRCFQSSRRSCSKAFEDSFGGMFGGGSTSVSSGSTSGTVSGSTSGTVSGGSESGSRESGGRRIEERATEVTKSESSDSGTTSGDSGAEKVETVSGGSGTVSGSSGTTSGDSSDGFDVLGLGDITSVDKLKAACDKHKVPTEVKRVNKKVRQKFHMKGISYEKVMKDETLKTEICDKVVARCLVSLEGYLEEDLECVLKSGSVIADIEITPVPGADSEALTATLEDEATNLQSGVLSDVKNISNIESSLEDGFTVDDITAEAEKPETEVGTGNYLGAAASLGMLCLPAIMLVQLMA